jgi:hypothetical protein
MTEIVSDLHLRESRTARRLGRLFKIECAGGFDRWPLATIWRLVERRGAVIRELFKLDELRRSLASSGSSELDQALRELARDVSRGSDCARFRAEKIDGDLRARRGDGVATGIRSGPDGQLLGKG